MRTRSGWAPLAVAVLLAAGAWVFLRVYLYSAEPGDVFPEMSSLRADPRGTRALHDALEGMPGYRVRRWFRPLKEFHDSDVTMLFLGEPVMRWQLVTPKELEEIEAVAARGVRFAVALRRAKTPRLKALQHSALETRWRLKIANGLEPLDDSWQVYPGGEEILAVERSFGKGSVVFAAQSFPFTNEALRDDRDSQLVVWMLGNHRDIVFDEEHLGTTQSGSVGTLIRRFHLEPAAAILLLLAALFIWRQSSSFLPAVEAPVRAISGRDSAEGLASLLRRAIPPQALPAAALGLWRKSAALLPAIPASTRQAVEQELSQPVAPAQLVLLWRNLHRLTTKRT